MQILQIASSRDTQVCLTEQQIPSIGMKVFVLIRRFTTILNIFSAVHWWINGIPRFSI